MRFKQAGNKADIIAIVFRNNDVNSTKIFQGAPAFYITDAGLAGGALPTGVKGLDVDAADGLANANHGNFAGINMYSQRNIGDYGEAMAFGYYDFARVLLSTRPTSTDVWASYAAVALGDIYSFVTTSGVQAVQRSGAGSATNLGWWIMAAQTIASATTQASSVTNGGFGNSTAMVTQLRVQIRAI